MKNKIFFCVTALLFNFSAFPTGIWAQGEKHDVAVAPVVTLGEFSEIEQEIISRRLQSQLNLHYRLIAQSEFVAAQQEAYDELATQECTEEQCIRKIKEILKIDRIIVLQLVKEGTWTQMSLTLIGTDGKIVVDDLCQNCDIQKLYPKVDELVKQLAHQEKEKAPTVSTRPHPVVVAQGRVQVTVSRSDEIEDDDGVFQIWVDGTKQSEDRIGGLSNTAFRVLLPDGEHTLVVRHTSGKYSSPSKTITVDGGKDYRENFELSLSETFGDHQSWKLKWRGSLIISALALGYVQSENTSIKSANDNKAAKEQQMNTASTPEEAVSLRQQALAEANSAKTHQKNAQLGQTVGLAFLGIAAWIWFDEPDLQKETAWRLNMSTNHQLALSYNKSW